MAKQKLSQRSITVNKTGGFLHIIIPSLVPGTFESYRIPVDTLVPSSGGGADVPILLSNKTGNVSQAIPANSWIDKITVFFRAGTPVVRVGTSPNGQELMMDVNVTDYAVVYPELYTGAGNTLYFTVNSGYIDVRIDYKSNYNGNI